MRPFLITTAAALLIAATAAWADTKSYDITGFTRVEAVAGLQVEVVETDGFEVRAEGDARALTRLVVERRGDTLSLSQRPKGLERFSPLLWMMSEELSVRVSLPALAGVTARSGSKVSAEGGTGDGFEAEASSGARLEISGIGADSVALTASSGATLRADGRCGAITLDASSGASIRGRGLECDSAGASASSGASIDLSAQDVEAEASSGGSVAVWGASTIRADESSGGAVVQR